MSDIGVDGQQPELTFEDQVRQVLHDELRTPLLLPAEFRSWIPRYIEGEDIRITLGQVTGGAQAAVPIGVILPWPTATAPDPTPGANVSYFICDGQAISRLVYKTLFNLLGTSYGTGDGSTTYNVPNLKGRAIVGRDVVQTEFDTLGETGGTKTHTLAATEMPSHTHTGPSHNHVINADFHNHGVANGLNVASVAGTGGGWTLGSGYGGSPSVDATSNVGYTHSHGGATAVDGTQATGSAGSGGAHNNLPPYIALNYIIRAL